MRPTPRFFAHLAPVIVALLAGCGPSVSQSPPQTEPESSGSTSTSETAEGTEAAGGDKGEAKAGGDADKGAAKADAPTSEAPASEAAALARDFLKTGGRRIGYSASKKAFAYPVEHRSEAGFGLDIQFIGADGQAKDAMRVCQIGECEEHLDELAKELLPKLTSRLEQDGYVSIRGIGWPQGRDELEVNSLTMKLKYTKGKIEALREGKPAARLTQAGTKRLDAPTLLAVFVVPDSKLLGVFAPPSGDAKGLVQDFYIFKLP
jgi:hypothetical protein